MAPTVLVMRMSAGVPRQSVKGYANPARPRCRHSAVVRWRRLPAAACHGAGPFPGLQKPIRPPLPDLRGLRLLGGLRFPRPSGAPFLGDFGSRWNRQLGICPLLAGFPKSLYLSTEVLSGLHLMAHQF